MSDFKIKTYKKLQGAIVGKLEKIIKKIENKATTVKNHAGAGNSEASFWMDEIINECISAREIIFRLETLSEKMRGEL